MVFDDIGLMGSEADSERVVAATRRVRVFAGYAGWGGGQLEAELDEPSWVDRGRPRRGRLRRRRRPLGERPSSQGRRVQARRDDARRSVAQLTAFRSQTRRRPSSVSQGSTRSIVRECGAIRSASPPVAIAARFGSELAADARHDLVHLADEAVDEPRLQRRGGRLADHGRRRRELDAEQPRGALEQRVHRDLDPGREDTAERIRRPRRRRRSSSTCRSRRRSPARRSAPSRRPRSRCGRARPRADRRSAPGMPVRRPGPSTSSLARREAADEVLVRANERRNGRREADAVDRVEIRHERLEQCAELVTTSMRLCRDAPVVAKRFPVVEPEDGLRVADVDREQHVRRT